MPMGWNLAVRFAQAVHLEVLFRAGDPSQILIKGLYNPNSPLATGLYSPYIDDLGVFGTGVEVNLMHTRIKQEMERSGLPVSSKNSRPADQTQTFNSLLGMDFYKDGTVRP